MLRVLGFVFLGALVGCGSSTADGSSPTSSPSPSPSPSQSTSAPAPAPPAPNGGNCTYTNVIGTATITSIDEPGDLDDACTNDGVVARFSFVPDDATAPSVPASFAQVDEGNRRLTQGNKLVTRGCLQELALDVGSTFRVERLIEASGTCTPVIYIPQIDVDACKTSCDR